MDINSVASSPLGWPVELLNSARAHHALELTKGAYTQKLIEYRKTLLDAVAEAERGLASDAADPAGSLAKLQDIRQTAAAIMEQALDIREDLVAQSDDLGIAPGETTAFLRSASLTANHHFGTAAGNDHLTSTLEHAATKLTQTIDAQRLTEQCQRRSNSRPLRRSKSRPLA
ncbi:hypothetical protein FHS85_003547 [Rhodoligotrophos appendicifer]|uniref:hypothetical protein n=1 Tax=Rhodoligotrophos appendicifer TaxID=987056 RepID=UPI00118640F8|nr:hypothetical protein [Rhodoligotrophos appendicifer]